MAWSFEHTAESAANPRLVWQRYLDVEHWCEWSRGETARSAPAVEHIAEPKEQGSRITHRVALDGPLAFLYAGLVGKSVAQGLADCVERLAAMAAADR